jgi:hypothetical protein
VKTWVGRTVVFFDVEDNDTVMDLMIKIHWEDRIGIRPEQQRLICKGQASIAGAPDNSTQPHRRRGRGPFGAQVP